jgi:hypothetical protein
MDEGKGNFVDQRKSQGTRIAEEALEGYTCSLVFRNVNRTCAHIGRGP